MSWHDCTPKVGDVLFCTADKDVGVVLKVWYDYADDEDSLMVEVAWSSGDVLADPWHSVDFSTDKPTFTILSVI